MPRPRVLAAIDYYLPGFKAGGPIRSMAGMVEHLGDEFDFRVITRDRDLMERAPYPGIRVDAWQEVGKARVFYASPAGLSWRGFRARITEAAPDVLYLSSAFSPGFTLRILTLRRAGLLPDVPVVVGPRGEFSPGALAIRAGKKRALLRVARLAGLYRDVLWHASSVHERRDVERTIFGGAVPDPPIATALDLSVPALERRAASGGPEKEPGRLRIAFLSRISRKKNLDGALRMLHGVEGAIELDIYGLLEDPHYWAECQALMESLPPNVSVRYRGVVEHHDVPAVLGRHDLLFLPTHGENFGHVILESLAAGCPVLLSDQTPWRELEAEGVGWEVPLGEPERFREILRESVRRGEEEQRRMAERARAYAARLSHAPELIDQSRQLLWRAVGRAGGGIAGNPRSRAGGGPGDGRSARRSLRGAKR